MPEIQDCILKNRKVMLADLVNTGIPHCVLEEVRAIIMMAYPSLDFRPVEKVHVDIVRLYTGEYPGYRECSTGYHDLRHTMDVCLAMARFIHGAYLDGVIFRKNNIVIGLVSALLHDAGYILTEDDSQGSGGKYTAVHVERSIEFMKEYFDKNGYSKKDEQKAECLIQSTSLSTRLDDIPFKSGETRMLGKMLFAADLFGQMADRLYLEKLHFLYYEFMEGRISGYSDEKDLLNKTIVFANSIKQRIFDEIRGLDEHAKSHFKARCNINRDMYSEAIEGNLGYLKAILSSGDADYREKLKRNGILERLDNLMCEAG